MTRRVRVKRGQRGWFAAGPGFERAMGELSDAAFKVLAYVCLRAERASGCLEFEREGLSREVGKSRSTLGRCLRELAGKQVCELEPAPSQHRLSRLRVREEYWPYEVREVEPARQPGRAARNGPGTDAGDVAAYVRAVRQWFCQPGLRARPVRAGGQASSDGVAACGSAAGKRCGGPSCWAACASR